MSRRNRGVYEPEFRLVLLISLLVGAFGYVGWAIGNENHMPWIGAVVCLAYVPTPSSTSSCHLLSRTPHKSSLTSALPLTYQDDVLQHPSCRRCVVPVPDRSARQQRDLEHPLPRRLRQECAHLRFGLLCQRHRPLRRGQGHPTRLRGLPGCVLAYKHPDVRVWEADPVVRECSLIPSISFLRAHSIVDRTFRRSRGILVFSTETKTFRRPISRDLRPHPAPTRKTEEAVGKPTGHHAVTSPTHHSASAGAHAHARYLGSEFTPSYRFCTPCTRLILDACHECHGSITITITTTLYFVCISRAEIHIHMRVQRRTADSTHR